MGSNSMQPEAIAIRLQEVVKETGIWMREERKRFDRGAVEHKGQNDLVSYVDKEAEQRLIRVLSEALPGCGFVNEESGTQKAERYNWIIDPLDGTTNYIHGLPVYAVSVALVEYNELQLGCVYDPVHDEMFFAEKGQGAFLNGLPIRVSSTSFLKDALVATGFPYSYFGHIDAYLGALKEVLLNSRGIRRPGAAAIDLVWTACGRFDAFYESWLNPWDVAAGILILREAGGKVTTFTGNADCVSGKEILASNGHVHDELADILVKFPVS
jgi:myo-inositol-1(or 4)-monophosphatase